MKLQTILVFCLLMVIADQSMGQGMRNRGRNRNLILGAGTGAAFYFGDLAADGDFSNITPNLALSARYNFYRRYSVETQLTWFMLSGHDKKDPIKEPRNLSFSSHNFELNLLFHASLYPEAIRFYQRPFANPYVYAGIGLVQFNPTAKLDGERYNLRKYETEGPDNSYGLFTMSIPLGIGVKLRASPFLNINIDGGFRWVLSDYLDDVSSGHYPDPTSFEDDIARQLSDRSGELGISPSLSEQGVMVRGNPNQRDAYLILNVRAEYFFGSLNLFDNRYGMGRKPKAYRPRNNRRR